jgi:hypothetical protein
MATVVSTTTLIATISTDLALATERRNCVDLSSHMSNEISL